MKKILLYSATLALALVFAGCTAENPISSGNSTPGETVNSSVTETSGTEAGTTETAAQTEVPTFTVSVEEAIQAYQDTVPDSDIISIELDSSFGNYFYKIEGVDDNKEYEVSVDAETKEIKESREETLDRDEQNGVKRQEDQLDLTDLLSIEEVTEVAMNEVSGGQATDWDLEKEMNVTYWDVQIEDASKETNIKIHAQTGEVLEVEVDD